jgi:GNAT superfamily N-acetyltransferase
VSALVPNLVIRPYGAADRQAVRDICAATCWMGEYRPEMIPDDWVWAEYWTRYFTDREPQNSWVVCEAGLWWHGRPGHVYQGRPAPGSSSGSSSPGLDSEEKEEETHGRDAHATKEATGRVVGYLTGTVDESHFRHYAPRLLPGLAWHVIRRRLMRWPRSRRAILSLLGALVRDEMRLPPGVERDYPATCHIDLLPQARGGGIGTRLFETFLARMRSLGVRGVHQQPLDINPAIGALLRKMDFAMVESHPIRAYAHFHADKVELQTWVRKL